MLNCYKKYDKMQKSKDYFLNFLFLSGSFTDKNLFLQIISVKLLASQLNNRREEQILSKGASLPQRKERYMYEKKQRNFYLYPKTTSLI